MRCGNDDDPLFRSRSDSCNAVAASVVQQRELQSLRLHAGIPASRADAFFHAMPGRFRHIARGTDATVHHLVRLPFAPLVPGREHSVRQLLSARLVEKVLTAPAAIPISDVSVLRAGRVKPLPYTAWNGHALPFRDPLSRRLRSAYRPRAPQPWTARKQLPGSRSSFS